MARPNAQQSLRTAVNGLDSDPLLKSGKNGTQSEVDDDKDDDDDEEALKSLPDEDDLRKAMSDLSETVTAAEGGQSVRQQDLAARLADGDELSKSEREELTRHLSGDGGGADLADFTKSSREEFAEDPTITEGWEMSGYLDARDSALCKSLDKVVSAVQSSSLESDAKIARLAKGMHATGSALVRTLHRINQLEDMIKSIGGQPNAPRAATRVGQTFTEGDARQTPANEPLAKSGDGAPWTPNAPDLKRGLTLLIKSTEPGGKNAAEGFGIHQGTDLVLEQAKLEQTGQVSTRVMSPILEAIGVDPRSLGL